MSEQKEFPVYIVFSYAPTAQLEQELKPIFLKNIRQDQLPTDRHIAILDPVIADHADESEAITYCDHYHLEDKHYPNNTQTSNLYIPLPPLPDGTLAKPAVYRRKITEYFKTFIAAGLCGEKSVSVMIPTDPETGLVKKKAFIKVGDASLKAIALIKALLLDLPWGEEFEPRMRIRCFWANKRPEVIAGKP